MKSIKKILIVFSSIMALQSHAQFDVQRQSDYEPDATSQLTLNGIVASQRFGNSVASCGDLNGDGIDDIIVSAHLTNSNTGRVYIYFGGINMNTASDIILNGETVNNYFGISVADAGDVNGDGFNDVIAGAYGYSSNTGRAYLYYGGFSMDNVADVVFTAPSAMSFGYSVSSAGDVNGDGYSDVIVSGHTYSSNTGRAFIYYGGMNMDNIADKILQGTVSGGFFGFSLSGAGDVNGDGFTDVLIGAYAVSSFQGRAYLYYGGSNMDTLIDVTFSGEASNHFLGQIVSDAADVNGDGYDDILIAAPSYLTSVGRVYVHYGSGTMDNVADVVFTGESTSNNFGRGISKAGDVNGDGFGDIIIGSQSYAGSTGKAYVYFGGSFMNNIYDMTFNGEAVNNFFGFSVSGGNDFNGDGYKDMLVGAYGYSSNKGRVYIYKNTMNGADIPDVRVTGIFQSEFGYSVSHAGDVNGDGFKDYIVGAPSHGDFANGRVSIFYGSLNPDTIPDVTINGPFNNGWFGWSVASAGDLNADGYDDIIVGSPEYDNSKGRIYIYFGGSPMDTLADMFDTGTSNNWRLGHSVSSAGDYNNDGYGDVIAGAIGANSERGYINIYLGGTAIDSTVDFGYSGTSPSDQVGFCVRNIGDINGDGLSDIAASSPGYDTSRGSVTIYFGGQTGITFILGESKYDRFGHSISDAGDFNRDGFGDLLIGALYGETIPGQERGKAYLYYGNSYFDNVSDLQFFNYAEYQFSFSLSGAGDVNNDGFDDIVIGEHSFNNNYGRAFVYFGSFSPDNNHDIVMNNNSFDERLGYSLSGGGDINGDGLSDIIAGANTWNSSGAAYLYLSSAPSVKPILLSVKDVPNDQGGKLILKWVRSSYDIIGTDMITEYLIQRSLPPGSGGFVWENIANIPATRESYYAFTDNTPFDSLAGNSGTLYYRITAQTNNQNNFWRSNILFGRSIDNIAPLKVLSFTAAQEASNVRLNWERSSAPDFLKYILFRSYLQTIDPDTETPFATLTDSTLLDTSPLSGSFYYFIVAQDIHNNSGPVAISESPKMILNLKMFVEGFYSSGSNSQISDTVLIELKYPTSPYSIADQSTAVVLPNGTVQLKFGNTSDGNYYFAVRHRNSIETWSANPIIFSRTMPVNYDLTGSASQAFGDNMIRVDNYPLSFAIFSGDVNQDGVIDASDNGAIDNDATNFETGYLSTDLTGDEVIDASDAAIADNNAASFVAAITP